MTAYLLNLATLAAIFGILSASLNVLIGYAGIFSLAHAVFFGIGAYTGAQMALHVIPDVLVCCIAAAILSGLASLLLALPALRVRGEYFVAASLGLQMVGVTLFSQGGEITGGQGGLVGIPDPELLGFDVSSAWSFFLVCLAALISTLALIAVLMRGSFGRSLMALRDSEDATRAFGKNVPALKALAMALGCALAGVAGVLFAFQIAFVNVESFTLDQSVLLLAMVIIGGAGTLAGPLAGTLLLLLLPALLSFAPFIPPTEIGAVQQMIYGLVMVLLMIFRPAGLVGLAAGRRQ